MMRSIPAWLWLFPILLFLGCGHIYQGIWPSFPDEGTLTGRVILESGRGFEDVDVSLIYQEDEQGSEEIRELTLSQRGEFRFEELLPGEYYLEIIKPRYDPYFYQFQLQEDERIYLEVELKRYSIPEDVWQVLVVGDFMDWDPQKALPMTDDDGDGLWETATPLPAGRYSYKYIINGLPEWFIDVDSRIYEPDGLGYYSSVVEILEARLVPFVLDTNDPWFRRAALETPARENGTGQVYWEPEEPRRGQEIAILYDPRGGPLEDAEQIFLHWGVNGWMVPRMDPPGTSEFGDGQAVQTLMEQLSGGSWWVVVPTDQDVTVVDFVFTDGQNWDNNQTRDWHVPVR